MRSRSWVSYQNKQAGPQHHDLAGYAVELGGDHGCRTEDTAGEGQAKGHGGVEDSNGVFLGIWPVLRVGWVIRAIPTDQIGLLMSFPSVGVALIDLILLLGLWISFLQVVIAALEVRSVFLDVLVEALVAGLILDETLGGAFVGDWQWMGEAVLAVGRLGGGVLHVGYG